MTKFYIKFKTNNSWDEPEIKPEFDEFSDEQLITSGYHKYQPVNNPNQDPRFKSSYENVLKGNTVTMVWTQVPISGEDLVMVVRNKWEYIRNIRDSLLDESDWTQISDNNLTVEKKDQWKSYRQLLRDITTTTTDPFEIIFPKDPTGIAYNSQIGVFRV